MWILSFLSAWVGAVQAIATLFKRIYSLPSPQAFYRAQIEKNNIKNTVF